MVLLVAVVLLSTVGVFAWAFYQQLLLSAPFGDNPMSDTALVAVGIPVMLLGAGLTWLLWAARLITEVRTNGVYYRYLPFIPSFRRMSFDEIESFEPVTHNPWESTAAGAYAGVWLAAVWVST